MSKLNGRRLVTQLIRAYEEEDKLYDGLERSVTEQRDLLLNGRDPRLLAHLVEHQRHLAEDIGKIETAIAPLRDHWERIRDAQPSREVRRLGDALDDILERLAERIHAIVEVEKDNTRELLAATDTDRVSQWLPNEY